MGVRCSRSVVERADVEIRLLGGFEVRVRGRTIEAERWRLRKARSIVKLIALAPGHRITRERAMDVLWPDLEPDAADNNLRQTLHVARRALDPDPATTNRWLSLKDDQLALCPDGGVSVDAAVFVKAVAQARASRDPKALAEAVELYSGDLLPDDLYEDWAIARREELRETHLAALLELARAQEAAGQAAEAVVTYERAVTAAPALEEAHVGLMRLHAGRGDRRRALHQFELLARALREDLDAEPDPASARLRDDIAAGRVVGRHTVRASARPHNLPAQLTTFVGRVAEHETIAAQLQLGRLVTLTGPGGSGKTRLAIAAAEHALLSGAADSAFFVDLAPLAEGPLVSDAVAAVLAGSAAFTSLATALARLREATALVILDNCEHVLGGVVATARAILDECPEVRVVATSRQSLGVVGERIVEVPPLEIPVSTEDAKTSDAVRLFLDRVHLARPTFVLNERTTPAVVEICRRLDGLPLAIELAAAQLRVLSLEELVRRIDDRFRVLIAGGSGRPARHQTLRAAIDWSYEQLPPIEQLVFERLSVFRGPWYMQSAESIVPDAQVRQEEVSGIVASLVDRSLVAVVAREDGSISYRMLDTIRDYARGRLAERDDADQVALRHADHFIAYAERGQRVGGGAGERRTWLRRLYEAGEELRGAFQLILARSDRDRAMRFGAAIVPYYLAVGNVVEGTRLLEDALALDDGQPTLQRARLLSALVSVRTDLGDPHGARRAVDEALDIARGHPDDHLVMNLLSKSGAMLIQTDPAQALRHLEEALALSAGLPEDAFVTILIHNRANYARSIGDRVATRALYERGLAMAGRIGAVRESAMFRHSLGTLSEAEGDLAAARSAYGDCLVLARELDDWYLLILALGSLAWLELGAGRHEEARALRREALEKAQARQERALIAHLVQHTGVAASLRGRPDVGLRLFFAGVEWAQRHVVVQHRHGQMTRGWRDIITGTVAPEEADRLEREGRRMPLERAVATILEDPSL